MVLFQAAVPTEARRLKDLSLKAVVVKPTLMAAVQVLLLLVMVSIFVILVWMVWMVILVWLQWWFSFWHDWHSVCPCLAFPA